MRVNGWFRLWIVAILTWLAVVFYLTWQSWPKSDSITHIPEFLSQIQPQSALYQCPSSASSEECYSLAPMVIEMPNGYRLLLSAEYSDSEAASIAHTYWDAVDAEYKSRINSFILSAGMLWLGPSLAILLLGLGDAWVRRGFRLDHT